MRVVVTGGGGFLGRKLIGALLGEAAPLGQVDEIVSLDRVAPPGDDPRIKAVIGDLADSALLAQVFAQPVDYVWHLAAAVSGECEADLDLGLTVNFGGTLNLLQALRHAGQSPRLVFASSVAVYGGDLPAVVDDDTVVTPDGSYGAQKVMGEYLVKDFSRRGLIDGRSLRLPTVVVRPGKPNAAASGFASGILREPLSGQPSVCPVAPEAVMAIISPRRTVEGLLAAAKLPAAAFGPGRVMNLPGISVSVAESVEALRRAAGPEAVKLISWKRDPKVEALVESWPKGITSKRALAAGLRPDESIDAIVAAYIEDDRPAA